MFVYEIKRKGQFATVELVHAQNDEEALAKGANKLRESAEGLYVTKRK